MSWQCPKCGFVLKVLPKGGIEGFTCRCSVEPGWLAKSINFAAAAAEHAADFFTVAPDDVRAARLATCHACPLFNGTRCTHPKCGCPVKQTRAFIDKIGWASSKCPDGKWTAHTPT